MRKETISKFSALAIIIALVLWGLSPLFSEKKAIVISETTDNAPASAENKIEYKLEMPQNNADSAIVIDAESGSILFEKNANMIRGMASTTKIMTALVALENQDPETEFNIPKEAVGIEGSSVYLQEGEPLTLGELLYCLLLESGNDAATAIAICVGGSLDGFVEMMNQRASELGLSNTHFKNPHGLSEFGHHTTAKELASITAEAMKYPLFKEIVSTKTYNVRYNGTKNGRVLSNHNKLLSSYDGAIGVKTGYTDVDGKCLVSAAERNGLTVIAVTLDDPSPTSTHKILLDKAFNSFERRIAVAKNQICADVPVINGEKEFVTVCNTREISVCLPKGAKYRIELDLPAGLNAPLKKGDIIAYARVFCEDKEVYIISLEVAEDIKIKEKSYFDKLFGK